MRKAELLKSLQRSVVVFSIFTFFTILSPLFAESTRCSNGEKPLKIELAWGVKFKCADGSTPQQKRPKEQIERKEVAKQKSKKNSDIQEAQNHHERLLTMMLKSTFRAPEWEKYITDSGIDFKCTQRKPEKEFVNFIYDDDLKSMSVGFRGTPPDYDNCALSSHSFQLAKETYFAVPNQPSLCLLHVDEDQRTPFFYVQQGGDGVVGSKDRAGCLLKIKKHGKKAVATVNLINLEVKTRKGIKRYDGFYKLEYDKEGNSVKELELKYSERE